MRDIKILKTGWRFYQGENESAFQTEFDDSQWQEVRVPHDWAIAGPFILDGDASTGKLPWKAQGWYRTKINIEKNGKRRRFYLLFDGIILRRKDEI